MGYTYSITPTSANGSAVRPQHNTDNTKLPTGLPHGKYAYGNTKWVATEDKYNSQGTKINKAGDVWLEVLEVNGVVLSSPAWIAEIHLGQRYATITQIKPTDPPPDPEPEQPAVDEIVITQTFAAPGYTAQPVVQDGNKITVTLKPDANG